jgi:hypothetical protein
MIVEVGTRWGDKGHAVTAAAGYTLPLLVLTDVRLARVAHCAWQFVQPVSINRPLKTSLLLHATLRTVSCRTARLSTAMVVYRIYRPATDNNTVGYGILSLLEAGRSCLSQLST